MVNWVLVGDASNGVLAGAYGVVAVLFLLSHWLRRLPKTGTIRNFLIFLVLLCIFRGLYFGVPNSVWELPEEPETDIPRFTQRWWLNLTQFALYVIANSFMFFQFLTILRLWDHALCVVNNSTESKMERWTPWMMAAYAVWQTWLVAANCVLQTGTVLFMASVSHLIVSVLIALAFVGFWLRLWKAMAIVTMHRSRWQTLKYSCAACCACCVGRPDDMTVPLNDASQFENVASARAKLSRFTLLAAVYTGASVIKAAIMLYQMAIAVAGCVSAESWWAVIFVDYASTEIVASLAVLFILWKPPRPTQSKSSATMSSPPASRLALRSARPAYHAGGEIPSEPRFDPILRSSFSSLDQA